VSWHLQLHQLPAPSVVVTYVMGAFVRERVLVHVERLKGYLKRWEGQAGPAIQGVTLHLRVQAGQEGPGV
jgi:hypothetical protein